MKTLVRPQAPCPAQGVHSLEGAFAQFVRQAGQFQEAYQTLERRAAEINRQLEETNLELERKVRLLDQTGNFQRSILASIPSAVIVTDLEGTVNIFNPAAEKLWGVAREAAVGQRFSRLLGEHGALLEGVLAGRYRQESTRRELPPEAGAHRPRIISSTACLVEDSAGQPIGAVQVDQDTSRLFALEVQLCQQAKLAELGQMAAGLAHEIRKPLNGIRGFASILDRTLERQPSHGEHLRHIIAAADQLNGMLGRLLDFARPDFPHIAPCNLREQAEQVLALVRAEQHATEVQVSLEVPEEARVVWADAPKLQQVLLNLVKNGIEAISGPGRVTIAGDELEAEEGRFVRVTVADTGKGIAPEKLPRVLEPFYSEKPGGTGLGLSIVSRILQLHGAELNLDSEPGRGTRASFILAACSRAAAAQAPTVIHQHSRRSE